MNFIQKFNEFNKIKNRAELNLKILQIALMDEMNKIKKIFQFKKQKILIYEKGLQILDGLIEDQTYNLAQPRVQIMTLLMFRIQTKQIRYFLSMFEGNNFVLEGKPISFYSDSQLEEQMKQYKKKMNQRLKISQNKASKLHVQLFNGKLHRPLQEQFGEKEPNLIQLLRNHETEPLGIKYCNELKRFVIKYCIPSNLCQLVQNEYFIKILQIDFICQIEKIYPNKQPYNTSEMKQKFQIIELKMTYSQAKLKIQRMKNHKRAFIYHKIKLISKCLQLLHSTKIIKLYLPQQYYGQVLKFILLNWYHLQLKNFLLSQQNNFQSQDFTTKQLKRQVQKSIQQSEANITRSYKLLCGVKFFLDQSQMESTHCRIVAFIRYYQSIIQSRVLNKILSQFLFSFGMPNITSQTKEYKKIWIVAANLYLLNVKQTRYSVQQHCIETIQKQFKQIQNMDIIGLTQFIKQIAPKEYIQ